MKFEFDYAKSLKNKEKHGIDFTQASKLWDSPVVTLIHRPQRRTPTTPYWNYSGQKLDSHCHSTRQNHKNHQHQKEQKK
jgi:uncharacterized DUF497 family protein